MQAEDSIPSFGEEPWRKLGGPSRLEQLKEAVAGHFSIVNWNTAASAVILSALSPWTIRHSLVVERPMPTAVGKLTVSSAVDAGFLHKLKEFQRRRGRRRGIGAGPEPRPCCSIFSCRR